MSNYIDRYVSGEHKVVWDELMNFGSEVRQEPLYAEAVAVAQETMRRAEHNCSWIVKILNEVGYNQPPIHNKPPSYIRFGIAKMEELINGHLPISLVEWYKRVGSIDLTGTHPNWMVRGVDVSPSVSLNAKKLVATQPLQVYSLDEAIRWYWRCYYSRDWTSFGLLVAEEAASRSGFSGGDFDLIALPSDSVDGVFLEGCDPYTTFVDYLRRSFEWGGFPGFANVPEELRPTEMLNYLREGLLPI